MIYSINSESKQIKIPARLGSSIVKIGRADAYVYVSEEKYEVFVFDQIFMDYLLETGFKLSMGDTEFMKRYVLFKL